MYRGLLIADKPKGPTSHDVVEELRKKLKIRKIGHAGTLDPFATGVLIIGVGNATRLLEYMKDLRKTYRVKMKLGIITDTFDITGNVVEKRSCAVSELEIIDTVLSFVGSYRQVPPAYSARKYKGERLYKLARAGKIIRLPPRQVTIHGVEDIEVNGDEVSFTVETSSGTYIRSLCADIGYKLGCGATAIELRRTAVGRFTDDQAVDIFDSSTEKIISSLIDISKALDFPKVSIKGEAKKRVLNGGPVFVSDVVEYERFSKSELVQVFVEENLMMIARAQRSSKFLRTLVKHNKNEVVFKPEKVFKD